MAGKRDAKKEESHRGPEPRWYMLQRFSAKSSAATIGRPSDDWIHK
jgi:hypothetical protein